MAVTVRSAVDAFTTEVIRNSLVAITAIRPLKVMLPTGTVVSASREAAKRWWTLPKGTTVWSSTRKDGVSRWMRTGREAYARD